MLFFLQKTMGISSTWHLFLRVHFFHRKGFDQIKAVKNLSIWLSLAWCGWKSPAIQRMTQSTLDMSARRCSAYFSFPIPKAIWGPWSHVLPWGEKSKESPLSSLLPFFQESAELYPICKRLLWFSIKRDWFQEKGPAFSVMKDIVSGSRNLKTSGFTEWIN